MGPEIATIFRFGGRLRFHIAIRIGDSRRYLMHTPRSGIQREHRVEREVRYIRHQNPGVVRTL